MYTSKMEKYQRTYVIAVSGGVDSVALLDLIVSGRWKDLSLNYPFADSSYQLVVAHFDHGIREDSGADADFVEKLAAKHQLPFELGAAKLGKNTSENTARIERYSFLQKCRKKYKAQAIITAHHQDDVLETAIINLLRGTGWRGLVSLGSTKVMLRPLLNTSKRDIVAYAKSRDLTWREDSTNKNQRYLRNYIRHSLIPAAQEADSNFKQKLLQIIESTHKYKTQINAELTSLGTILRLRSKSTANQPSTSHRIFDDQLPTTHYQLPTYPLTMYPISVSQELIYHILTRLDPGWHPRAMQIKRSLHFIKTARNTAELRISKHLKATIRKGSVQFKKL